MITLDLNVKSVLWHINVHCSITKWIESNEHASKIWNFLHLRDKAFRLGVTDIPTVFMGSFGTVVYYFDLILFFLLGYQGNSSSFDNNTIS